jgi:Chaperone of endosialidase
LFQIENYFAPSIGPPGLSIFVEAGVLLVGGSGMPVAAQAISLPANSTSFVYLNTNTGLVTSNPTGFPASNCWPIATVVTGLSGVVSLKDNRPDVGWPGSGTGGTVTQVNTAGIATGGPITTTGTITVAGSGNTTTAATANANLATAPAGDVVITDGSGNVGISSQSNLIFNRSVPEWSVTDGFFLEDTSGTNSVGGSVTNGGVIVSGNPNINLDASAAGLTLTGSGSFSLFDGVGSFIQTDGAGNLTISAQSMAIDASVGIAFNIDPTSVTPATNDNSTKLATTAYVQAQGYGKGTVTSVSFTGGLISVANPTTTPAFTVAGTSGGVPYFSSATTWTSSAVLPAGDFVLGGGAGNPPTASFSIVPIANGGTATGSTLTGIVRGGNPFTASELSGDATTSGSNAVTLATVNSNVGTFTYATITVNGKGLVTAASSGAAPTGTVTSFSAGNLSPLFTTSVATATTTPALTFSLSNAAGGTVFGNNTGSSGASAFTAAPVLGVNASTAGTLGLANGGGSGATVTLQNLGATTAYNWNYPTTAGAAGSVLTSQAGGSTAMTWTTQASLGVAWSSLTNATANLSLSNGTNTTTFNQTSDVTWMWANTTTATASTTNISPILDLVANYWTGSASAADTWSFYTSLAAGTNGVSTLTVAHAGSSGNAYLTLGATGNGVAGLQFFASPGAIDFGANTSWELDFTNNSGTTTNGKILGSTGNFSIEAGGAQNLVLRTTAAGKYVDLFGEISATTSPTGVPSVIIENSGSFIRTSGSQIGLGIGFSEAANGFTFNPASGTASFVACQILATIEGTSSGSTTALQVNPTLTATNLTGTNLIASFQSGGTNEVTIDYSGNVVAAGKVTAQGNLQLGVAGTTSGVVTLEGSTSGSCTITAPATAGTATNPIAFSNSINLSGASTVYQAQGTSGVTQTAEAVGTLATIGGIVTTFTAVSDERLKIFVPYNGGLEQILAITPIRYRWNETGQKLSGQKGDRDYVGFSAQNAQSVIPETIQSVTKDGFLSFEDRPIIAALVNAVKTLSASVQELLARIEVLEKK